MSMAVLHWARVETVHFGATMEEASPAGFNELQLPTAELMRWDGSRVKLAPGLQADECRQLIQAWKADPRRDLC